VNVFDGPDVDAARRLADDQEVRVRLDLARDDELLLVAAGEFRRPEQRVRRAHVEFLHLGACPSDHLVAVEPEAPAQRLVMMPAENDVLAGIEGADQAPVLAVLRHMGQALRTHMARIAQHADVLALEDHLARGGPGNPRDHVEEFRLSVAGDAGDADDFALPHAEGDVVDAGDALFVLPGEVLHLQHRFARCGRALLDAHVDVAAHHQLGQFENVRLQRLARRQEFSAAHDGDMIGDGDDLAKLVGDENDGLALVPQCTEDAEQVIRLVGREHARRFVEDQRVRAPEQGFQDFDALLEAHGQFAHDGVRVDLEFIIAREAHELGAGLGQRGPDECAALGTQHHVLEHCEGFDQHEMLVHHADAKCDGIRGGLDPRRLPLTRISPLSAW
jgi:hypothetical protein